MEYIIPFKVLKFPFMENNMIDDILAKFDGAFAKNTIRAYRSDFIQYRQLPTPWRSMLTTLPPSGKVQLSGEE
jgi:hypothetical protein